MHGIKTKKSNFVLFLTIFIICSVLTAYHFRYLKSSFKIDTDGNVVKIGRLNFLYPLKNPTLDKNIRFEKKILVDSGYTISFDIKTLAKDSPFFYTSSGAGGGSIYWNISLIEGKIQTARLGCISPILTDKKVNDNNWHHVFINTGGKQQIFIDQKLESTIAVAKLYLPDAWFNFNLEADQNNPEPIHLKNIVFLNRAASFSEVKSYSNYFDGYRYYFGLLINLFISWMTIATVIISTIYGVIIFIKNKYPNEDFSLISQRISTILPFFLLPTFLTWTPYRYKIFLFSSLLFGYLLTKFYKKILPVYLANFIFIPISFLETSLKLLIAKDFQKLSRHLFKNEPSTYFILFIFLAFLLIN